MLTPCQVLVSKHVKLSINKRLNSEVTTTAIGQAYEEGMKMFRTSSVGAFTTNFKTELQGAHTRKPVGHLLSKYTVQGAFSVCTQSIILCHT